MQTDGKPHPLQEKIEAYGDRRDAAAHIRCLMNVMEYYGSMADAPQSVKQEYNEYIDGINNDK